MDEAAWGALALTLTLLGGAYTWFAYRRRGLAAAVRGAGLTLLPVAAWLTGVLRLLTDVGDAVGDWAVRLAVSPRLWVGVVLAGVAVALVVGSGFLARQGVGAKPRRAAEARPAELPAARPAPAPATKVVDEGVEAEMAEIEAILRNRGIT